MQITDKIMERMKHLKELEQPSIIGIDGLSGAGKTTITATITKELTTKDYKVVVIHIDDLIVERAKRYNTGHPEWYEYYYLQWDVHYIKENLFGAVQKKFKKLKLKFYDKENDQHYSNNIDLEQCKVILIEGIFLQRKEWRAYFDYMIYLDCPKDTRYERVLQRDVYIGDMNERLKKYERRYWLGENYYLKERNPLRDSDFLVKGLL